jgi:hypothetical protein
MVRFMVWGGDEGMGLVLLLLAVMVVLAVEEDSASTSEEVFGRCDRMDCLRYIGWVSAGAGRSCGEDETETKSEA